MPLLPTPRYQPPFWLANAHLETVVPSLFRKVELPDYQRERIATPDGDFMDLDWLKHSTLNGKLVIVAHGLEGDSSRPYVKGMAKIFYEAGYSVLAWNCRSCSGEMNRAQRMYHHGVSDDLDTVVQHAMQNYSKLVLVGFSMGGSIILKYLGEQAGTLPSAVRAAVAFSVPCDLGASARALSQGANAIYRKRFLKKLKKKVMRKAEDYPEVIDCAPLGRIDHFPDFDSQYTAKLHGFTDANDFYTQSSAGQYLQDISIPTLLVNAENDPMLPESCYPIQLAEKQAFLFLEIPKRGGHVGFSQGKDKPTWAEERALAFAESIVDPD